MGLDRLTKHHFAIDKTRNLAGASPLHRLATQPVFPVAVPLDEQFPFRQTDERDAAPFSAIRLVKSMGRLWRGCRDTGYQEVR